MTYDAETKNRRARLRELIHECFNDRDEDLLVFIKQRTGKRPNQGELSAIQKDDGSKSFGDKKAKTLTEQIGLHRRWFDFPLGSNLHRVTWLDDIKPATAPLAESGKVTYGQFNKTISKAIDLMNEVDSVTQQKMLGAIEYIHAGFRTKHKNSPKRSG